MAVFDSQAPESGAGSVWGAWVAESASETPENATVQGCSTVTPRSPLDPFVDLDRGRARFRVTPRPPRDLPQVDGLLAGAAQVDITPPPGMPKAGYSANAHTGVGFRTRLRARAVHLRNGTTSIAIVQCDLLGGSSVLQHLVADALANTPDVDVPLAGLMIGATHTHAGPGQFLGTDFYNRFASNHSGFDPAYTQFLVNQITHAVTEAVRTRRPAKAALGRTDVWGLTRNRSLAPHVRNPEISDKRLEPQRKFVSINPWLHLLRVDGLDGVPISANVVFSVHGTGVSMRADEYNADVWAYLYDQLLQRTRTDGPGLVVGAMEGTHADMAPAIRPGCAGHVEAARVGRAIGDAAADLWRALEADLTDDVPLACGVREVSDMPAKPAVGAALIAGATENTTPIVEHLPFFKAGGPKRSARGPHAEKWVVGSRWLQPLVVPTKSFPRLLPIQVLRIGSTCLVGLPFEVTVESGRRIAAAIEGDVIVTSVANEYSGYCTTPEEYQLQYYEGGHTIFGPQTQPYLAERAAALARDVDAHGVVQDVAKERSWDLKVHRFLARPSGRPRSDRRFVADARFADPTASIDGCWSIEWDGSPPRDLHWHEPLVRVEGRDAAGGWFPVVDDQRPAIEVLHVGDDRHRAIWWDPSFRAGRRHRFVLCANAGYPELASEAFD
jgi:neutral ceramidase